MNPSKPSTIAVCALHYAKLLIRLAIFITLLVLYVLHHVRGGDNLETVIESHPCCWWLSGLSLWSRWCCASSPRGLRAPAHRSSLHTTK